MAWSLSAPAILASLCGVMLVWCGIEDARARTIANWKNAAIALAAPAWWWANGIAPWPGMAIQLAIGLALFVPFCAAFAAGWMGGGDVKMIGALGLWLPVGAFVQMLIGMSLIGGAITLLLMIEARLRRHAVPAVGPAGPPATPIEIPYGMAIAAAALLVLPGTLF